MAWRSEEHTSELQSRLHLVCRLLLEKKKHTSELQSRLHLVCRLLLEKKNSDRCIGPSERGRIAMAWHRGRVTARRLKPLRLCREIVLSACRSHHEYASR